MRAERTALRCGRAAVACGRRRRTRRSVLLRGTARRARLRATQRRAATPALPCSVAQLPFAGTVRAASDAHCRCATMETPLYSIGRSAGALDDAHARRGGIRSACGANPRWRFGRIRPRRRPHPHPARCPWRARSETRTGSATHAPSASSNRPVNNPRLSLNQRFACADAAPERFRISSVRGSKRWLSSSESYAYTKENSQKSSSYCQKVLRTYYIKSSAIPEIRLDSGDFPTRHLPFALTSDEKYPLWGNPTSDNPIDLDFPTFHYEKQLMKRGS